MKSKENILDISDLPKDVQNELLDFWEFLKRKYSNLSNFENSSVGDDEIYGNLERLDYLSSLIKEPSIEYPEEWQKKTRKDKTLIGR